MHGWGVSRRIQQVSDDALQLTQGTIYPALLRLEQRGWISAEWGTSDSNRKARFYAITRAGRKQLQQETQSWERMMGIINRVLEGV
jgi:transcriptional regulator